MLSVMLNIYHLVSKIEILYIFARKTRAKIVKKLVMQALLFCYNLNIQKIWGQGYDGGSNMHGERNGVQALILKACPHAYYTHCLAYHL